MIPSFMIFLIFYCVIDPIHTLSCPDYRTDQVPAGIVLRTPGRVPCSEAMGCASVIHHNIKTDIWVLLASYCLNECRNESWSFLGAQYRLGCCNLSHCPPNGDYFDDVELQHRVVMPTHEVSSSHTRATVTHTSVIRTPQASSESDDDENPSASKFNIIYIVCSVVICIEIVIFFVSLLVLIREIRIFLHRRKYQSTELQCNPLPPQ